MHASDGTDETGSLDDVQAGDLLCFRRAKNVPVDAEVVEGKGTVDESSITGETIAIAKAAPPRSPLERWTSYFPAQKSVAACEAVLVLGGQRFVQERTSHDMSRVSLAAHRLELRGSNHSQLLDKRFRSIYLNNMKGKEALITEIEQASQSMIQGSLTELTRKCGDPSCACATDPARRHGPHLYLMFNAEGKAHSVYVPREQGEALKEAHRNWLRFQEIGAEIAADNRERFLRLLQREKEKIKAQRARARKKA